MIKRFIRWLARVFGAEITVTTTKVIVKDGKTVYLPPEGGTIEGDVTVRGDLVVYGNIKATGDIACLVGKGGMKYEQL